MFRLLTIAVLLEYQYLKDVYGIIIELINCKC